MEFRHIRYFLAVAEEKNVTRAAAKLGINQPPLSQQIKDLEREVGSPLFYRLPQGVELTDAGKIFLQSVKDLPTLAEQALQMSQKIAKGLAGFLHIGFTGTAALNPIIPQAIKVFKAAYPDVELRVSEGTSIQLREMLLANKLDIAIIRPSVKDEQSLHVRNFATEQLVAVLSIDHPLATLDANESIQLHQLAESPFILTAREDAISLHDAVTSSCQNAGFSPIPGPTAPQIASILSIVSANLGVALLPESMTQLTVAGVTFRKLTQPVSVPLALTYRQRFPSSPTLNFERILKDLSHAP
jgi:DNA-binding transcriptional LysR family regulator